MKNRTKSRQFAVQALYSWLLTEQNVSDVEVHFINDHDMEDADVAYFQEILHFVTTHKMALIDHMESFLSRAFASVDPVEQAILLVGVFELEQRLDIPYRVSINESVECAKVFGAEDGHKFINGIMDKVAGKLRAAEMNAPRKKKARKK
ncbi:transcription antitermination factor NusB [sulfur-oxidizing endosymbiont of Gigantopelta aegis]|uniref:transcription antitermination factor NusB n=1 Tax=sulfur-oxidizing endosymbiont of Gigantopelta aegis TaxID=2794934 RepID=UPI001FEBBFA6|nr:transcription antitermination factor NusB [sulfur-oxidizing endosymbiont of Gigantopelta aegis]